MRAIRVHEVGGPEVLRLEELPVPEPGPGEVLVRLLAIGVNFIDTYKRKGLYPVPAPFTLGEEGAGVVEKVGEGVVGVRPGDRVAFANVKGADAKLWTLGRPFNVCDITLNCAERKVKSFSQSRCLGLGPVALLLS